MRALGFLRLVLAWAVLVVAGGLLLAAVVIPRLTGATSYEVQTDSMQPTLQPGTLVVVRPVDPDEVGVGTIITYQLESGESAVATHRVAEIGINNATGERTFRTKGDANDGVDPEPVRPAQLRGEVWYAVPYVGHLNTQLTDARLPLAAVTVLLGYAAMMFLGAARDRRARQPERETVDA